MAAPTTGYAPLSLTPTVRQIAERIAWLFQGKRNSHSEVTLAAGAATTTLTDSLITATCHVDFTPLSAHAQADMPWVSARANGSCTLNHANAATTDRTFSYDVSP